MTQTQQRSKPTLMTLTDRAAERVRQIMAKSEGSDKPVLGLRLGVKKGGCAGMEYTMDYVHEIKAGDDVIEEKGVKIFVDPMAILYLLGTEMDFKTEKLSSGFVFNNPNQKSACGCGESIELVPASKDKLESYEKSDQTH